MRELEVLDERHYTKGGAEEECEDYESDHLWESLIDVSFVAVVQACEFNREPNEDTNDQSQEVNDVEVKDPELVYDGGEDNYEVHQVKEEVIVEHHLKGKRRVHWDLKDTDLIVWNVVCVLIDLMLSQLIHIRFLFPLESIFHVHILPFLTLIERSIIC